MKLQSHVKRGQTEVRTATTEVNTTTVQGQTQVGTTTQQALHEDYTATSQGFTALHAQQQVFDFFSSIGQGTILAVAGDMTPFTGNSFDHSRFLSQLLFWIEGQDAEYVPISFKEWLDTAKLGRYAVEQARHFFVKLGVLEYKVKKDRQGNPVCHYRLDFKSLMSALKEFFKSTKNIIFSSYAESFKAKSRGSRSDGTTSSYPPYKERYKSENIGRKSKMETKEPKPSKYEKFYL